jgi:hypothetical protein
MWYGAGADLVVVAHLLFICFIVGGVFLTWRWPLIIWAHIPAVIYGALVEFVGFTCPLTLLENELRQRAGEAGYGGGFISHYLVRVIYPPGLTHGMQIGLGVLLLLVAISGYWGFLRRHRRGIARALTAVLRSTSCHHPCQTWTATASEHLHRWGPSSNEQTAGCACQDIVRSAGRVCNAIYMRTPSHRRRAGCTGCPASPSGLKIGIADLFTGSIRRV